MGRLRKAHDRVDKKIHRFNRTALRKPIEIEYSRHVGNSLQSISANGTGMMKNIQMQIDTKHETNLTRMTISGDIDERGAELLNEHFHSFHRYQAKLLVQTS